MAGELTDYAKKVIIDHANQIIAQFGEVGKQVVASVTKETEKVTRQVSDTEVAVKTYFNTGNAQVLQTLRNTTQDVQDKIVNLTIVPTQSLSGLTDVVKDIITNNADQITNDFSETGQAVVDYVKSENEGNSEAISLAKQAILTAINNQITGVWSLLQPALEWFGARLEDLLEIPAKILFKLFTDFFFEEIP